MVELILGGQKGGKSRTAESRAAAWLATPGHEALLIATALASNLMLPLEGTGGNRPSSDTATSDLLAVLRISAGPVVLVSNEIGWGVSPMSADARRFIDALGSLHQRLVDLCQPVTLMVAGRALSLPVAGAV